MANQPMIDNMKIITDLALEDLKNGVEPDLDQKFGQLIRNGTIYPGGQTYEKTLNDCKTYYNYIKGNTTISDNIPNLADPMLSNMKVISDKAIADRKNGYTDPNIEETMRDMIRSGKIKTGGQTEEKTLNDAISYYNKIKGTDNTGNGTTSTGTSTVLSSLGITGGATSTGGTSTITSGIGSGGTVSQVLSLDNAAITDIISKINTCIEDIGMTWQDIQNNEINKINNSWIANEAKPFVDKTMEAGNKLKTVNEGLKLLANTYASVINESGATGENVSRYINNIQ